MKSIEEKEIEFFMNLLKNDPVNTISIPKHHVVAADKTVTNGLRTFTPEELTKEANNRNYICFRVPQAAVIEVCEVLAKYAGSL